MITMEDFVRLDKAQQEWERVLPSLNSDLEMALLEIEADKRATENPDREGQDGEK